MSGFQKLFIFLVVVLGAGYFALQWKVDKDVQEQFDQLAAVATVDYDKASIGLSGKITVSGLLIRPHMMNMDFHVAELTWNYGNIINTLFGHDDIKQGELPEQIGVSIKGFDLPLSELSSQLPPAATHNPYDVLAAAACGDHQRISFHELVSMGYDNLLLSFSVEMNRQEQAGTVEFEGDFTVGNMNQLEFQLEMDKRMLNQMAAMGNPGQAVKSLAFTLVDQGYHQLKANYCSGIAGTTVAEYKSAHVETVNSVLEAVDIQPSPELLNAYADFIEPGGTLFVKVQPDADMQFGDLAFYDAEAIQNMLGLEVEINGKQITRFFESWNAGRFAQIVEQNPVQPEKAEEELFEYEPIIRNQEPEPEQPEEETQKQKEYQVTSLSQAPRFIGREVIVLRSNGKTYEGMLVKAEEGKLWVDISMGGGTATIPVDVAAIDQFQVLRE